MVDEELGNTSEDSTSPPHQVLPISLQWSST
jgi:hypothetical protein